MYASTPRIPADYPWVVLREVVECLRGELPSDLSIGLLDASRRRDPSKYLEIGNAFGLQSINRGLTDQAHTAACLRLVTSLIAKHESLGMTTAKERKEACIARTIELDRTLTFNRDVLTTPFHQQVQAEVLRILGHSPDLAEVSMSCRHGPGSSTVHAYANRSSYFKYSEWPYVCTPRCEGLLREVIAADPRWVGALEDSYRDRYRLTKWSILDREVFWRNVIFSESPSNEVTSVPKDSTKDRAIAKEPPGNVFLQLGIDGVIRRRLRVSGNPIDDQERNRQLALEGSVTGKLATIDLSDASDTIHMDVIKATLPEPWFNLLSAVRSPYGELPDGTAWRYAKMSSMGNGTTFVLETVMFLAIARACGRLYGHRSDTFAVFGDDIVCPTYLARHVMIYLQLYGFVPNKAKSFIGGPIRESCGVDAFRGVNIRPVFLKTSPKIELDVYSDRNRLQLWWLNHYGSEIPCELDNMFFRWLRLDPLFGPVDPTDVRSCLQDVHYRSPYFYGYSESTRELPARQFMFRKLMHSLRGPSEGGMFRVEEGTQRLKAVKRVAGSLL